MTDIQLDELNIRVAKIVFECKVNVDDMGRHCLCDDSAHGYSISQWDTGRVLKHYSSDASYAFEVVSRMKELGYSFVLMGPGSQNPCDGCFEVKNWYVQFQRGENGGIYHEESDGFNTPEEAICLTALQTLEEKK